MNPTPTTAKVGKQAKPATEKAAKTASHAADAQVPGWVAFVGAGPGDENLLTVRAAALIGRADLVVAPQWIGEGLGHLLKPGATLADSDAQLQDPKILIKAAKAGQLAVRLFGGDPFMFCNAATDAAACAKARVPFEIVPGVSAATAVPEYAGIPLTADAAGEVRMIHASEVSRVTFTDGTLVILGAESGPVDLGKMLIAAGWAETAPLAITWNGTTTDQHTVVGTLGTIAADLKAAGVSLLTAHGPAVAVVGEGVSAQPSLSWFETKPLFGWRVLVPRTKEQADEVCDLLRARGAVPEQVPTIAVEPPRTPQQMERAVKGLVTGRYQWIGFTSVNAVRAIREKFEEYGLDARAFAGVKVAAVGEQTAAALRAFGIMPDLVPEGEQSAEGLAEAWPAFRRHPRPDQPGAVAAGRYRDRGPAGAADRAGLGSRGRDRLPDRAGRAAASADPGGDQGRRIRRGPVHLVLDSSQPDRDRWEAARGHGDRGDRPADGQDRG